MNASTPAAAGSELPKRVSWVELFFDLVFVFAVTGVAVLLGSDHSWAGLLRALIVFVPVYWVWVATAVYTNQYDVSRPRVRLVVLAVALAAIFMAVALPDAYGGSGMVFAISYWVARLVLGLGLLVRRRTDRAVNPYLLGVIATGPLLVVGALLPGGAREVVWGVAAAVDLALPSVLRSRALHMHVDADHLAERFGLFVLIALGESVVAIGLSAQGGQLDVAVGAAVGAAFALSAGLWWVYFHFAADAVRHALATARVQLDITRLVLSYGHLMFIGAIIVISVGLHDAVAEPVHHLSWGIAGLLFGGVAVYLAAFGFTRWTMFRLVSRTRLAAAAVTLLLLPAAPFVPALAAVAGLAVVLAVLNVHELRTDGRSGWRARLAARQEPG
jgi:low temperature requirement protein LtrA